MLSVEWEQGSEVLRRTGLKHWFNLPASNDNEINSPISLCSFWFADMFPSYCVSTNCLFHHAFQLASKQHTCSPVICAVIKASWKWNLIISVIPLCVTLYQCHTHAHCFLWFHYTVYQLHSWCGNLTEIIIKIWIILDELLYVCKMDLELGGKAVVETRCNTTIKCTLMICLNWWHDHLLSF